MPPLMKGLPVMTKQQDLSTLFIKGANGVQFSFQELFDRAKNLISSEDYFAGPALHKAYFEATGQSHLKAGHINNAGFMTYPSKPDYQILSEAVLRKLEKIHLIDTQVKEAAKIKHDYLVRKVNPELERGVDPEVLADIGY